MSEPDADTEVLFLVDEWGLSIEEAREVVNSE